MNKQLLLQKLAKLAVNVGINIQKGQPLVINAPVAAQELVRLTVHEAYLAGSGKVFVNWSDDQISKDTYQYLSVEELSEVPDFVVDRLRYFIDNKAAFLSIISPNPYAFQGVDPKKIAFSSKAMYEKTSFYSDAISASRHQWSIIAYPNDVWCKKVFPDDELEVAYDKLFEAIMKTSRISEDNDPVQDWDLHIKELENHFKLLNEYNFKSLHFKNNLGTDNAIDTSQYIADKPTEDFYQRYTKLSESAQTRVINAALAHVRLIQSERIASNNDLNWLHTEKRRHSIEWHKRHSLPFACLVFLFIGAPLGAIIRKGGLGMPLVLSTLLFITYYKERFVHRYQYLHLQNR